MDTPSVSEYEEDALRTVLKEASDKVPATLFSTVTAAQVIGKDVDKFESLEIKKIPLLKSAITTYHEQCVASFRETMISMHDIITEFAEKVTFQDAHATILAGDDSATKALDSEMKDAVKAEIRKHLEANFDEAEATKESIMKSLAIWGRGKVALEEEPLPSITFLSIDELTDLFYSIYMTDLAKEEIDLRTTPRMKGAGSLYEFFSSVKPQKKKGTT
jgi:hypothetical protein